MLRDSSFFKKYGFAISAGFMIISLYWLNAVVNSMVWSLVALPLMLFTVSFLLLLFWGLCLFIGQFDAKEEEPAKPRKKRTISRGGSRGVKRR